jgi:hypothetical protein
MSTAFALRLLREQPLLSRPKKQSRAGPGNFHSSYDKCFLSVPEFCPLPPPPPGCLPQGDGPLPCQWQAVEDLRPLPGVCAQRPMERQQVGCWSTAGPGGVEGVRGITEHRASVVHVFLLPGPPSDEGAAGCWR